MNDLATLKRAMAEPPGYSPTELDLSAIVQAGSRRRRRRRLAVGSASAAAVMAVLVGGNQLIGPPGREGSRPTMPGAATVPSAAPSSVPSSVPSSDAAAPDQSPYGTVIDTGLTTKGGAWVFYGIRINDKEVPGVKFGFMLGVRQAGGQLTPSVEINETQGSTLAPGFHQGEGPQNIDGRNTPAFGYYVGKPDRITAKVHGKQVTAHFKAWSKDPSVAVFWFSPADAGQGAAITNLAAYDRHGTKMAAGNPTFGLG